jgi:hypothetical protein
LLCAARGRAGAGRRLKLVLQPFGRAAVAFQLCFDPIDCRTVSVRPLPAIAELRQPFDRRFVLFEIEAVDQRLHRIRRRGSLRHGGRNRDEHEGCQSEKGKLRTHR